MTPFVLNALTKLRIATAVLLFSATAHGGFFNTESGRDITKNDDDGPVSPMVTGSLTDSDEKLCSSIRFPSAQRCGNARNNCLRALASAPNKAAVRYAFAYLRDNTGRLADTSCLSGGGPRGIKNTGQMLVNDMNGNPGVGYYINFCDSTSPLTKIRMNKGTGTPGVDENGRKSTVFGAFLTGTNTSPFRSITTSPKALAAYNAYNARFGQAKRLGLYGANSSNNNTADGKPMHESPLNSSSGCPSCSGPQCRKIMEALADDGPSLLLNYGPASYHRSTTECTNDRGDGPTNIKRNNNVRDGGQG